MRELTSKEVGLVSGGVTVDLETALIGGAVTGGLHAARSGATVGAVLGPKGAVGGAIIAGTAYGVTSAWYEFRDS